MPGKFRSRSREGPSPPNANSSTPSRLIDHLFAYGERGRQAGKDCLDLVGRQPVIDDEIAAPEAEIVEGDQPEPLLTTDDDFVEATQKLVASKNLEDV